MAIGILINLVIINVCDETLYEWLVLLKCFSVYYIRKLILFKYLKNQRFICEGSDLMAFANCILKITKRSDLTQVILLNFAFA